MASANAIIYSLDGNTACITLNRPDHLNAMTRSMSVELIEALDEADGDSNVRAVVLTGEGRAFCAGADLSEGVQAFSPSGGGVRSAVRDWGGVLALRIFEMMKPTIAAVNGPAVGIGATMTLPCDVRIASNTSKFGFVFTRRGIVPDGCASWFLPRLVGIDNALRWCVGGAILSADQARAGGLVSALYDPDELRDAARDIARELTSETAAVSVALTRQLLWRGLTEAHPMDSHRYESRLMGSTSASPDAREGVESFLEKRSANFQGHVPEDIPKEWPLWPEQRY